MRWEILDEVRASELGIWVADTGSNAFLVFDMKDMPKGMTYEEFMEYIQREKIVRRREDGED